MWIELNNKQLINLDLVLKIFLDIKSKTLYYRFTGAINELEFSTEKFDTEEEALKRHETIKKLLLRG